MQYVQQCIGCYEAMLEEHSHVCLQRYLWRWWKDVVLYVVANQNVWACSLRSYTSSFNTTVQSREAFFLFVLTPVKMPEKYIAHCFQQNRLMHAGNRSSISHYCLMSIVKQSSMITSPSTQPPLLPHAKQRVEIGPLATIQCHSLSTPKINVLQVHE